ncbi:hypothetical protein OIU74_013306 [Salix koriyanagi]|uniref:Uncharacterized protein n=1 Tax=Salix koriyanagi TaxID=2511006 RepID=A0A9Q0T6C6_9ROSI|nr:hypothetical protein OIU74_013306 [Salix koriyanagi]
MDVYHILQSKQRAMVRGIGQMDSAGEGVGLVFLTLALCTTVMFEQCQGRSVYEEPANCLRLECAPYQLVEVSTSSLHIFKETMITQRAST